MFNKKPIFIVFCLLIFAGIILILLFGLSLYKAKSDLDTHYRVREERKQQYIQKDQFITEVAQQTISEPTITDDNPARGNPNAKITIVEFSDFGCPFCSQAQTVLKELDIIYKNKINFVWKDFPNTGIHKDAKSAHIAARCAEEQNKFWEYQSLLFANQEQFSKKFFVNLAMQLKLNLLEFNMCIDSKRQGSKIDKDVKEGIALGLSATPTFYVNNIKIDGLTTLDEFKTIIDSQLLIPNKN